MLLFSGLLTAAPDALLVVVVVAGAGDEVALDEAVMATSVTQTAPLSPQAFTCRVCLPAVADTVASIEVLFTIVVSVLLSSEKPMAETGWFEQVVATAESVNCRPTFSPLVGLFTVTLAIAGIPQAASRESMRDDFLRRFMESLSSRRFCSGRTNGR